MKTVRIYINKMKTNVNLKRLTLEGPTRIVTPSFAQL